MNKIREGKKEKKIERKKKRKKMITINQLNIYINLIFIFGIISIIASFFCFFSENPIYSIYFLVLVFISMSCFVINLGCDFLGLIILTIYIGAISVLFLFSTMLINIKIIELKKKTWNYNYFLYLFLVLIYFIFIYLFYFYSYNINIFGENLLENKIMVYEYDFFNNNNKYLYNLNIDLKEEVGIDLLKKDNNINNIGKILFLEYYFSFILIGLLLLVAMVGSIVLVLNQNLNVKRQDTYKQNMATIKNTIKLKN